MVHVTPSVAVCYKSRPPAMVDVAGTNSFPQAVFEALLWCPSVVLVSGEFTIQCDLIKFIINIMNILFY